MKKLVMMIAILIGVQHMSFGWYGGFGWGWSAPYWGLGYRGFGWGGLAAPYWGLSIGYPGWYPFHVRRPRTIIIEQSVQPAPVQKKIKTHGVQSEIKRLERQVSDLRAQLYNVRRQKNIRAA